jgi:hypothetical protein
VELEAQKASFEKIVISVDAKALFLEVILKYWIRRLAIKKSKTTHFKSTNTTKS